MPERRERMLSVRNSSIDSLPLDAAPAASVPLQANPANSDPDLSGEDAREPVSEPAPPPAPRFLSQVEEAEEEPEETVEPDDVDQPTYYSATAPVAESAPSPEPQEKEEQANQIEKSAAYQPEESETPMKPARPRFAELAEEPAYAPRPREYVPEFTREVLRPVNPDERRNPPAPARLTETNEANEATQPDLEKPTFLRRLGF
jgi:hypothetical protein